MAFTIEQVKSRISSKIRGFSVNKVKDFYGSCHEAAQNIALQLDPKETTRVSLIENAIYDEVYDYVLPADVKAIKDLRPSVNREKLNTFLNTFSEEFDRFKKDGEFTINYNNGVKYLRASKSHFAPIVIDEIIETTGWSVGGDTENLALDTNIYVSSKSSLKFGFNGNNTTGYVEKSTISAVDISDYEGFGSFFMWVYFPSATDITSINLRIGSSASSYFSGNATSPHSFSSFSEGWNLVRFDWGNLTETGTVDTSIISYSRVTFTYDGDATTNVRLDSIVFKVPTDYEVEYYSNLLFRSSAGVWKEIPTADTDIVNLDVESIPIFVYELAVILTQEIQSENQSTDLVFFENKRKEAWSAYKRQNPSERKRPQVDYYRMNLRKM